MHSPGRVLAVSSRQQTMPFSSFSSSFSPFSSFSSSSFSLCRWRVLLSSSWRQNGRNSFPSLSFLHQNNIKYGNILRRSISDSTPSCTPTTASIQTSSSSSSSSCASSSPIASTTSSSSTTTSSSSFSSSFSCFFASSSISSASFSSSSSFSCSSSNSVFSVCFSPDRLQRLFSSFRRVEKIKLPFTRASIDRTSQKRKQLTRRDEQRVISLTPCIFYSGLLYGVPLQERLPPYPSYLSLSLLLSHPHSYYPTATISSTTNTTNNTTTNSTTLPKTSSTASSTSTGTGGEDNSNDDNTAQLRAKLDDLVKTTAVVLFMKGSPQAPECGFSKRAVAILEALDIAEYTFINILKYPEIRALAKKHFQWPTYPLLIVGGEVVGGLDIMEELHKTGQLRRDIQNAIEKYKRQPTEAQKS